MAERRERGGLILLQWGRAMRIGIMKTRVERNYNENQRASEGGYEN